jgi:hypothetical protein
MILRTPVALHGDVKETTQCIGIFVTSTSVIFAVYFICTVNGHSLFKITFFEAVASSTGGDITVLGLSVI